MSRLLGRPCGRQSTLGQCGQACWRSSAQTTLAEAVAVGTSPVLSYTRYKRLLSMDSTFTARYAQSPQRQTEKEQHIALIQCAVVKGSSYKIQVCEHS